MKLEKLHAWAFKLLLIGLIIWFVLTTVAMILYPGGTAYDPNTVGYTFWANHFSDLGMKTAFNGESNITGCLIFTIAVIIMGISTFPAFISFPGLFSNKRDKRWIQLVSACSIASAALILIIIFFPADSALLIHVLIAMLRLLVVLLYGIFGTIAFVKLKEPDVFNKKYAIYFVILTIAAFVHGLGSFIYDIESTSEMHMFIVVLQKIRNYSDVLCSLAIIYGAEKTLKKK